MSWRLLWKGPVRIYFNSSAEAPLLWSVDNGSIETEIKCSSVRINIMEAQTGQRDENDPVQPKVWIEYKEDVMVMMDTDSRRVRISYL